MSVVFQHVPTLNGLNGASTESKRTRSRNQLRRQKAKLKKATAHVRPSFYNLVHYRRDTKAVAPDVSVKKEDDIQRIENVEYVSEQLDVKGAALEAFSDVFARFQFEPEDSTVRIAYQSLSSLHVSLSFR
jgi:splicing factor 3B subunit 2